jgi:hypothetical protein
MFLKRLNATEPYLQADPARFPGPGSSSSCLAGGPELAACLMANNDSSPEACGCKNGNEVIKTPSWPRSWANFSLF